MKFSSPITFSKKGIEFRYKQYLMFIAWMWFVPFTGREVMFSNTETAGEPYRNSAKLNGFDFEEVISQWVYLKYPREHLIILVNINVEAKNIQFWAKVPKTDSKHFLKDLVVLYCKDKTEVLRLVDNIPVEFAEAYGFSAGCMITFNREGF
jgi:hypothetical protein